MAGSRKLTIEIAGDAKSAGKAFSQVSNDATGFGKKIDGASQKAGETFTKFGVGALAVAGAIGVGLFKTGESASNLGESINAVTVTFGKSAAGILKLGENAATSVGLSNAAFNGLAVQFSAFATTIAGKGGDVVTTMRDMTGRAADFASVMNIDVSEAAQLFQSGLAGETEPLRKYGLDLSAAAVNAYAAANGIGEVGRQLTESEKVTARYGLLMASTSKNQGDFANTSDSAANAMRIAKAEMENASASIGASFAPMMAIAATKISELVSGFSNLNEATGGWLGKAAAIGAAGVGLIGVFSLVVGQTLKMHQRFEDFSKGMSVLKGKLVDAEGGMTKIGKAASVVGVALGVATAAFIAYQLIQDRHARQDAAVVEGLNEITRASKDQVESLVESEVRWARMKHGAEGAAQSIAKENLAAAIVMRDLALTSDTAASTMEKYGVTVDRLNVAIAEEILAQKRSAAATAEASAAVDDEGVAVEDTSHAWDGLVTWVMKAGLAAKQYKSDTEQAARDAKWAIDSLIGKWAELTGTVEDDQAWLNLQGGFDHVKTAAEEAFTAAVKGTADAEAKGRDYLLTIDDQKLAVINYAKEVLKLPPERVTEMLAEIDQGHFDEVERKLDWLSKHRFVGFSAVFDSVLSGSGGGLSYSAAGTPPGGSPGGWTVVGEQGPELMNLPRGTDVYSNADSLGMMGGNTTVVYVTVHGSVMAERDLTRAVYDGIIDGQARGELVAGLT